MTNLSADQIKELQLGRDQGVNISLYANAGFEAVQMREIRLGLVEKLDVTLYAKPEYDWFQMEEIRLGLKDGLDVREYADATIPFLTMRQLRKGMKVGVNLRSLIRLSPGILREVRKAYEEKVNISKYVGTGYDSGQLKAIRHALKAGVDIDPYISSSLSEQTITEISEALKLNLKLREYMDENIEWRQLREIRLGLEQRLPVQKYCNSLYSWQQMREIRLGLEKGLDVEEYYSLIHTWREMEELRIRLEKKQENRIRPSIDGEAGYFVYDQYTLMIDESRMKAFLLPNGDRITETKEQIEENIRLSGIIFGILQENIEQMLESEEIPISVLIAEGEMPRAGEDGFYEYLFDTEVEFKPLILEDGSVDYQNGKWFEEVKEGQIIARYYGAKEGKQGIAVNGAKIPGRKGKELPVLKGSGFTVNKSQNEYRAAINGKIELIQEEIHITPILLLKEVSLVSGNVDFEGTVHVLGDVFSGGRIHAGKDIYVDGTVEGASLSAGGNIMIRRGCNAAGKGFIHADGIVRGKFFERAQVRAGKSVHANSILNSTVCAKEAVKVSGRKGNIAGGKVSAGYWIVTQYLGNIGETPTVVVLDGALREERKLQQLLADKKECMKEIDMLNALKWQLEAKERQGALDTALSTALARVDHSIQIKKDDQGRLEQLILCAEQQKREQPPSRIEVQGNVYDGVTVMIGESKWKARALSDCILYEKNHGIAIGSGSGQVQKTGRSTR